MCYIYTKANTTSFLIMKTFSTTLGIVSLLSLSIFSSCDDDFIGLKGEGPVVEENRTAPDFDQVSLSIPARVFIEQGPKEEMRLVAQENVLENIETYVRGGELMIKFDKNVRKHEPITIYLTTPEVHSLSVSGSGDIIGENMIEAESLSVHISGSGGVELEVETEDLRTNISGSGKCTYQGQVDEHTIRISGSGDVNSFELQSLKAVVHVSGSGNSRLWVTDELDVRISGSGNVFYEGNPRVTSSISGSGKVIPNN